MARVAAAILAIGFGSAAATAPEPLTDAKVARIHDFVESAMAKLDVPGVAVALLEDGELRDVRGIGAVTVGGAPVASDTAFSIGSVSKSFTALGVLLLVEDGVISLDEPVVRYLPAFRSIDRSLSDGITVRHLLTHRSGFSTVDGNRNQNTGGLDPDALSKAVASLSDFRLGAAPGDAYVYSNANYQALGLLIETVSGVPYEQFVASRILAPLGMNDSHVGAPHPRATGQATGHRYWFGGLRANSRPLGRTNVAQGGIKASARDLAVYLRQFMAGGGSLISDAMREAAITPADGQSYAFGWFSADLPNGRLVYHTGANPGYEAVAGFSPDGAFGFVVLANAGNAFGTRNVSALIRGVGEIVMDRPPPPLEVSGPARGAFLFLCGLPVAVIALAASFLWQWRAGRLKPLRGVGAILRAVLPSALLLLLAYALYFVFPASFGAPIAAARIFNPDVGFLVQLGAGMTAAWATLRALLRLTVARAG